MKADGASAVFAVITRPISAALFTSWITATTGQLPFWVLGYKMLGYKWSSAGRR